MYGGDDHGGASERSHMSCVSEQELHPPYEREAMEGEQQEVPRLGVYRVEAGSPSPASQGSRLPVMDIDEPELVPDYSALPAEESSKSEVASPENPQLSSRPVTRPGASSVDHDQSRSLAAVGLSPGAASGSPSSWNTGHTQLEEGLARVRHEVLSEMSVMLQSVIQANLAPALDQVRMVQATVLSRLERLEVERSSEYSASERSAGSHRRMERGADVGPRRRPGDQTTGGPNVTAAMRSLAIADPRPAAEVVPLGNIGVNDANPSRVTGVPLDHGSSKGSRGSGTVAVDGILHSWRFSPDGELVLEPCAREGARESIIDAQVVDPTYNRDEGGYPETRSASTGEGLSRGSIERGERERGFSERRMRERECSDRDEIRRGLRERGGVDRPSAICDSEEPQTTRSRNPATETRCASPFDPKAKTPFSPYHSGAAARTWEGSQNSVHGAGLPHSQGLDARSYSRSPERARTVAGTNPHFGAENGGLSGSPLYPTSAVHGDLQAEGANVIASSVPCASEQSPTRRPRIVYPISPGGTEIKPPPPRRSPSRSEQFKHDDCIPSPPPPAPENDIQKLTAALEGAIRGTGSVDRDRVEDVKNVGELPKLEVKETERELTPLIAGDWVALIGPSLRDLSAHASDWWAESLSAAQEYYTKWLDSGPIERLTLKPERPDRFERGKYARVEQRAVSLLLKAVPPNIKDEVVSIRRMTSIEITGIILTTFQPGGLRERTALLRYLATPEGAKGVSDALRGVKRWARWRRRAVELGVTLPDATLLISGLDCLTSAVVAQYPEVQFRLQTFRHQHSVDLVPTLDKAVSLGEMMQAELQTLESSGAKKPKLARVDTRPDGADPSQKDGGKKGSKGSKGSGKATESTSGNACYHWLTSKGCSRGARCNFAHSHEDLQKAPDARNRCFVCSGLGHMAYQCPTADSADAGKGSKGGKPKGWGGKGADKPDPNKPAAKGVEEDKPSESSQASKAQLELLKETQNLIKTMQAKALRMKPTLNRLEAHGARTGLLDSGASTCLRGLKPGETTEGMTRRLVDLAEGSAVLYMNEYGTLISTQDIECIVALKPLIKLGCHWFWSEGKCELIHPVRGVLTMDDASGCPRMSEELALGLLQDIESGYHRALATSVRAIQIAHEYSSTGGSHLVKFLVEAIRVDQDVAASLEAVVRRVWSEHVDLTVGCPFTWAPRSGALACWNRRQRRACDKSERVMISYKGDPWWSECRKMAHRSGCEPLHLPVKDHLMSPSSQRLLLELAVDGKVAVILVDNRRGLDQDESIFLGLLARVSCVACETLGKDKPSVLVIGAGDHCLNPISSSDMQDMSCFGELLHEHASWGETSRSSLASTLLRGPRVSACKVDSIDWAQHIRSGHWPPHRRCKYCIMASAQQRAHRRQHSPASFCLCLDVVGPFAPVADDISHKRRYALVGALVVPVDARGRPVLGEDQEQAPAADDDKDAGAPDVDQDLEDLLEDIDEWFGVSGDGVSAIQVNSEIQLEGERLDAPAGESLQDAQGQQTFDLEKEAAGMAWREIVFVELLDTKTPKSVCLAVGRIHAQLVELGFPLVRIHADAGTEFADDRLKEYASSRGILLTLAPPTEHDSNGRIENVIKRLKAQVRTYLQLLDKDASKWALAFRSAAATWRADTLRKLGMKVKPIIPFGTRTQVLVRHWLRRRQRDWHMRATPAVVLAPATYVRQGYVVKVGNKLSVVTKLHFGEESDLKLFVGKGLPPIAEPGAVRRRMRSKVTPSPAFRIWGKRSLRALRERPGPGIDDDARAARLAAQVPFDCQAAVDFVLGSEFVHTSSHHVPTRCLGGAHYIFGACRRGGVVSLTRLTKSRPGFAALISRVLHEQLPDLTFTTVGLSVNAQAVVHKDTSNDYESRSGLVPLQVPKRGGRLWTALEVGDVVSGELQVVQHKGHDVVGQLHSWSEPLVFKPGVLHATEPWKPSDCRVVLIGYTVGCWSNMSDEHVQTLRALQFCLPDGQTKGGATVTGYPENFASFPTCVASVADELCASTQTQINISVDGTVEKDLENPNKNCIIHKKEAEARVELVPGEVEVVLDCVKVGSDVGLSLVDSVQSVSDTSLSVRDRVAEDLDLSVVDDSVEAASPPDEATLSCVGDQTSAQVACSGTRVDGPCAWLLSGGVFDTASCQDLEDDAASVCSWHTASEGEAEQAPWDLSELTAHIEELDRAQLRLSGFAEDRLARWLEHAGENETVDASGDTDLSEVQGAWDRVHELREELKALTGVEVSTRVSEGDGADTVLQTRTVSLPEVLANWEVWEHPANKEISALVEEKRALIPVDWKQVQRWKESGKRVTTIPAKAVWTIKAPDGRHKCRIVACGNMAPSKDESRQDHKDAVFASSLDVTHLRCALAVATRRSYEIAITDIRTAFLNAELLPRERVKAEQAAAAAADGESVPIDEIVILLPPRCLIQRGLVGRNTLWQVAKAIYGLDTSPRDLSLSRDFTLRRLAVKFQGRELRLYQSFADPNIWLVAENEPERCWSRSGLGLDQCEESGVSVWGWIGVYIDDLIIAACRELVKLLLTTITTMWKCGEPEWLTADLCKPLRFLGLQLAWSSERNLLIWQESYIKDLADRYSHELQKVKQCGTPLGPGVMEPEAVENIDSGVLRTCQRLIGELLWVSVRTRPDVSFSISKLAQWMNRDPSKTYQLGLHVLAYLVDSANVGLVYLCSDPSGPRPGRKDVGCSNLLEVLTDSSFAPDASRSNECCLLFVENCLVGWHVTRQPYMTQSSCETELLATATGCCFAQAHAYLLAELAQKAPRVHIYNDNQAAVSVFIGQNSHWRTRSLRIKARTMRERWEMGFYVISHIEGLQNGADLGTKPLGAQRVKYLCSLIGVQEIGNTSVQKPTESQGLSKATLKCLQVVLLACMMCQAEGHRSTEADDDDGVAWRFWIGVVVLVVCCWEGLKLGIRTLLAVLARPRRPDLQEPLSEDQVESLQMQTELREERERVV